jgi:hypothetical protein
MSAKVEIFKRTKEGKLEFYSGKTTLFTSAGSNMGPMAYDYNENYFTKDKVHLLASNYLNLLNSMSDNPRSVDFLHQYKTARDWQWGLLASAVVGVLGISQLADKHYISGSIITLLSAIIFQQSWTRHSVQDEALRNAIKAYNEP